MYYSFCFTKWGIFWEFSVENRRCRRELPAVSTCLFECGDPAFKRSDAGCDDCMQADRLCSNFRAGAILSCCRCEIYLAAIVHVHFVFFACVLGRGTNRRWAGEVEVSCVLAAPGLIGPTTAAVYRVPILSVWID